MNKNNMNAVIYARYSCSNQTEQSIEGQLRVCEEFAKKEGLTILNTYIDRAKSGTTDNRPEFRRMIKDSSSSPWKFVIVYAVDRFARDNDDYFNYKIQLRKNGIKILSATEPINNNSPEAALFESIYQGFATFYSKELSKKVSRGMTQSLIKGQFPIGKPPYGYYLKDKKLHIQYKEANIIRLIFRLYNSGFTGTKILDTLNHEKALNRDNKPFVKTHIYKILKFRPYTGYYEHNNKEYLNVYPPIISTELFNETQLKIKESYGNEGKSLDSNIYILSSKLYCGNCGEKITGTCGRGRNNKLFRYYKCKNSIRNNCPNRPIPVDDINYPTLYALFDILKNNMRYLVDKIMSLHKEYVKEYDEINTLENTYVDLQKKLHKQIDLSLNIDPAILSSSISSLTKQLQDVKESLDYLKAKVYSKLNENNIKNYLRNVFRSNEDNSLLMQRLIYLMVDKATLYEDRLDIVIKKVV